MALRTVSRSKPRMTSLPRSALHLSTASLTFLKVRRASRPDSGLKESMGNPEGSAAVFLERICRLAHPATELSRNWGLYKYGAGYTRRQAPQAFLGPGF